MLFSKYGGENVGLKNWMSHFSMFVPTKINLKLDNGNTRNYQVIGIVLCRFPKFPIMYPVGLVFIVQVAFQTPSHRVP